MVAEEGVPIHLVAHPNPSIPVVVPKGVSIPMVAEKGSLSTS